MSELERRVADLEERKHLEKARTNRLPLVICVYGDDPLPELEPGVPPPIILRMGGEDPREQ